VVDIQMGFGHLVVACALSATQKGPATSAAGMSQVSIFSATNFGAPQILDSGTVPGSISLVMQSPR
jgi:hypothetical protein